MVRSKKSSPGFTFLKSKIWICFGVIAVIIGFVADGFGLIDIIWPTSKDIGLTLFIHGPEGRMDRIIELEHKATITIDFNNNTQNVETIGEKGRVVFGGLPDRLRNKSFAIRLEGVNDFKLAFPDSLYPYNDQTVYVEVHRVNVIEGVVRDSDSKEGLEGVEIVVDGDESLLTSSKRFGRFRIEIPQTKTKKIHYLLVSKPGYKTIPEIPYRTGSAQIPIELKKTSNIK